MRRIASSLPLLVPLALASGCGGSGSQAAGTSTGSGGGGGGSTVDPTTFASVTASCAYDCPLGTCTETTTPYACQNLEPWAQIPHADSCATWDGTYPAPVAGKCTATVPTGDAIKVAGIDPDNPAVRVMPDGRRLSPAGVDFVFPDPESMTANVVPVAGTGFVLTVDLGYGDHIVRSVDPLQIAAQKPTLGQVNFGNPEALNQGLAFSPPDRVFVATAQGVVQALTLDTTTGALARDDAHSVKLPASPKSPGGMFYSSGVAVSADDTRLFLQARAVARAGRDAAFDPDAASPLEAITRTRAPVLLLHGRADDDIAPSQSEALHARALDHSELVLVDGEDHLGILADRSGTVWRHAAAWLSRWLDPR